MLAAYDEWVTTHPARASLDRLGWAEFVALAVEHAVRDEIAEEMREAARHALRLDDGVELLNAWATRPHGCCERRRIIVPAEHFLARNGSATT